MFDFLGKGSESIRLTAGELRNRLMDAITDGARDRNRTGTRG